MPRKRSQALMPRSYRSTAIVFLALLSAALLSSRGRAGDSKFLEPTFRVTGDLVVVPVSVSDRKGHTVLGLKPDDFTVLDDKVRQGIVSFSQWDVPSSIGVIFDVSGSMRGTESVAMMAVRALIDDAIPGDEGFLVSFADAPRLEMEMTHDFDRIADRLTFVRREGATALFDAVAMGLQHMKDAHTPRKALVVVTDGGDNRSRLTFGELLSQSLEADVQVYVIAIRRPNWDSEAQRGRLRLDQLAAETGGRLFLIDAATQLKQAMSSVGELIRNQYLIGYKRPDEAQSGQWRQIRLRVESIGRGSLRINARGRYYVPSE